MSCPSEDLVVAFAQGFLPPEEAAGVEAHLDVCDVCCQLVALGVRGTALKGDASPKASAENAPAELSPGCKVGRYVVLELVGKGAMGAVYAAYDPELDRRVALKLVHAERQADASAEELRGRLL